MPAFQPVRALAAFADRWLEAFCNAAAGRLHTPKPPPTTPVPAPRRRLPPLPVPPALLEPPDGKPYDFEAWRRGQDRRRFERLGPLDLVRLAHVVRHVRRLARRGRPVSARRLAADQQACRTCQPPGLRYLRQAPFLRVATHRRVEGGVVRPRPFISLDPPSPWNTFNAAARLLAHPTTAAADLRDLKAVLDGFHAPFGRCLPPGFDSLEALAAAFPRTFAPAPAGALALRHDIDDPDPQSAIPRSCDDGIHTALDLEAAAALGGVLFRLHAGRPRRDPCRVPLTILQDRLRRARPDLPQWRTPHDLRAFLARLAAHPRYRLDKDALTASLPADYPSRTEAMTTIIRVLAAPDGYADLAAVARLARAWMPSLPVDGADALIRYARGLRNSPYRIRSDGRITIQDVASGYRPPAAVYYPRFLAKQARLELGRKRLAALLAERLAG